MTWRRSTSLEAYHGNQTIEAQTDLSNLQVFKGCPAAHYIGFEIVIRLVPTIAQAWHA
ncbi:uncharacterized protein ARMOST_10026 [Armillaria ostoyae]|uniref:Uncharacterized protein n=1 Tax=Armillaria ostoyae TaxID=47428 RepID=A0A284RD49_ARMOS|nr:uncharacterized protein ARMOST_10026 [Armillaria ostoyae]